MCGAFTGHLPQHGCPYYRIEPPLGDARTFTVPLSDGRNSRDGLRRYRKALERMH